MKNDEFENVTFDQLKEYCIYYKNEYVLLSLAYDKLKREIRSLKTINSNLGNRFRNLQKVVDSNKLYFSDYEVVNEKY